MSSATWENKRKWCLPNPSAKTAVTGIPKLEHSRLMEDEFLMIPSKMCNYKENRLSKWSTLFRAHWFLDWCFLWSLCLRCETVCLWSEWGEVMVSSTNTTAFCDAVTLDMLKTRHLVISACVQQTKTGRKDKKRVQKSPGMLLAI